MPKKQKSGYCRSTVFSLLVILVLCVTGASAATLNPNIASIKVTTATAQIYDVAKPAEYSLCPVGYDCLTLADAAVQLGTYEKYSDTVCGYNQDTTKVSAVVRIPKYCVKKKEVTPSPAICPTGCSCMMESAAKEKFGTYSRCSATPCNTVVTGSAQLNAYCFRQGTTTPPPPCPEGCSCISEATAKAKGGSWSRCSADICGYDQSTATLAAVIREPKYCMKQVSTAPVCPDGCACISEATAKARYGDYTRCSADVCGYEQDQTKKYCIKQGSTTPACPEGCTCLSEAKAKERYGTFTRCTDAVCGKEIIQPATGAAAYSVPQYCVRQGSTPVCPDGCTCISDEDAKLKGLTARCDNSQTPCNYQLVSTSANTAAVRVPLFCYKIPVTTSPVCPQGCSCATNATAVEKGLKFCGGKLTSCGYNENKQPLYCFNEGTPPACPQGCYCLQEAEAKLKFGPNNFTRCQADICGNDPSATTANGIPRYCFRPTITAIPFGCPQGCTCTTNGTAVEKGLTFCGGKLTSCGYDATQQPLYCFNEVTSPACAYDYQKNVCTGTCDQGYTCGLLASKKDATGKVVYAACGCSGQPSGQCTFDTAKQACTGACQNGASCAVVGKKVDEKTGEVAVTCGCPQPSSCSYNYDREACVGTCTATGDICQLNTIYRDPATGKVTFAECHCKAGEVTEACACDAASGSCTGNCASGRACTMVERTTDNAGKVVCSKCECRGTCVLTANNECSGTCPDQQPCTRIVSRDNSGNEKVSCGCGGISPAGGAQSGALVRQPGILDGIFSFFNKLFGGK